MNIATLRRRCARLNGGNYDFPFGDDHRVYRVGGKIFAFVSEAPPAAITLKCDPEWTEVLRQNYATITSAPYLNKRLWNRIEVETIPDALAGELIEHSYDLVYRSLTRAQCDAVDGGAIKGEKRTR